MKFLSGISVGADSKNSKNVQCSPYEDQTSQHLWDPLCNFIWKELLICTLHREVLHRDIVRIAQPICNNSKNEAPKAEPRYDYA